ncbi:MAG: hypothetical protein ACYC3A_01195 [Halothiobacillus sp.]
MVPIFLMKPGTLWWLAGFIGLNGVIGLNVCNTHTIDTRIL